MLSIPVQDLLNAKEAHLELSLKTGAEGLERKITIPRIQKPGLALIGDVSKLHPGRVQVFGKSEITYLESLTPEKRIAITEKMCAIDLTCIILCRGLAAPDYLLTIATQHKIPVFTTPLITSTLINRLTRHLEERLTASTSLHGVLLDIFGVGVLILGKSGIGKSECAIDLILKGHRLIADDIVHIKKHPPATLYGMGNDLSKHHMEIRGLGILNVEDLFGVAAIRDRKIIEIVAELVEWVPGQDYERLGMDEHLDTILDVPVPYIKVPVSPGRNLTTIIEVAARNHLLKMRGRHSAREFAEKLNEALLEDEKINRLE